MSCYFIAHITIRNPAEYQKYLDGSEAVFQKFNGHYLAVDEGPAILEGTPTEGRIIVIEFPSEAKLRRWYDSPEYREILKHRLAASDSVAWAVKGL